MNRHFYGKPAGIPLSFFNTQTRLECQDPIACAQLGGDPYWTRTCTFGTSQDELILRIHLELKGEELGPLLSVLDIEDFDLCCHVTTALQNFGFRDRRRRVFPFKLAFSQPGECSRDYCKQCLSDYDICCSKASPDSADFWRMEGYMVSITGYHLLGDFRHPLNDKWRAFMAARNRFVDWDSPWYVRFDIFHALRYQRDMTLYPEGSIKKRWINAEKK